MITVKYSCKECGLSRREVIVPERDPDQDVVVYVRDIIGACIGDDHARISPNCRSRTMSDLMIPIDGADYVGHNPKSPAP